MASGSPGGPFRKAGQTKRKERSVRLSQTLAPFGVGAIYDYVGESLIACDLTYWRHAQQIRCPRLERAIGVGSLKVAPSEASIFSTAKPGVGVPYWRFPTWLFCPNQECRRLIRWNMKSEVESEPARCAHCSVKAKLVPMRFVMVCRAGHLDDVDWRRWAHSKPITDDQRQCHADALVFRSETGAGGGLDALIVRCLERTCRASRSLAGLSASGSLKPLGIHCTGRQPWQFKREECGESPEVIQRGATNIYFADIRSAIDIPEPTASAASDLGAAIRATPEFQDIRRYQTGPVVDYLISKIANDLLRDVQEVTRSVTELLAEDNDEIPPLGDLGADEDLASAEWVALTHPDPDVDDRAVLVVKATSFARSGPTDREPAEQLGSHFGQVHLVPRLREVRALLGFRRYHPAAEYRVEPDLGKGLDWRSAVEVFGEGLFLTLDEDRLKSWESRSSVQERVARLETNRGRSFMSDRLPVVSARMVLLHTLAHILIRRISYDAGYAAASLRERVYASVPASGTPQGGILIYTAAGDVEGTLGGLVRLGEPPHLARIVMGALEDCDWCSSDPICRESRGQGFDSLNLAACHACGLLPETSCDYGNALLDRMMLVGGAPRPGDEELGYFRGGLDTMRSQAASEIPG